MKEIYNITVKNYFNDSELEQLFLLVVNELSESAYRVETRNNLIGIYLNNNHLGNNSFFYVLKEESRFSLKFRGIDKTIAFNTNNLEIIKDNLQQNILFHNLQSITPKDYVEIATKTIKKGYNSRTFSNSFVNKSLVIPIIEKEKIELPRKEVKTNIIPNLPIENNSVLNEKVEIQIKNTEKNDLKIELPIKKTKSKLNFELLDKKPTRANQKEYLSYIKENINEFEDHFKFERIIKSLKEFPNYENKEIVIKDVQMLYYSHIKEKILKYINLKDFKTIQYLYQGLPKEEQTIWYGKIYDAELLFVEEKVIQLVNEKKFQEAIELLEPYKYRDDIKYKLRNLQTLLNNQKFREIEILYNDSQYEKVLILVQKDNSPSREIKQLMQNSELRIRAYNEALIYYKNKEYDLVLKKIFPSKYLDTESIIENSRKYIDQYNRSIQLFSMKLFEEAIEKIELSNDYKDAKEKLIIYKQQRDLHHRIYNQAIELFNSQKLYEAKEQLFEIKGYKDTENYLHTIEELDLKHKLDNIRNLLKEENYIAIKEIFTTYKEFNFLGFNCEFGMFPQLEASIIGFYSKNSIAHHSLNGYFLHKEKRYLKEEGEIVETIQNSSYGYGRNKKKSKVQYVKHKVVKFFEVQPLKWERLYFHDSNNKINNKYLFTYVSTKAITHMQYHEILSKTIKGDHYEKKYSNSLIYKYLNSSFLDSHFDQKIKNAIKEVTILDFEDYKKVNSQVLATDYAVFKGAKNIEGGCTYWTKNRESVYFNGNYLATEDRFRSIRPALTIDLKEYLYAITSDSSVRRELALIALKIIEIEENMKEIQELISNEKYDEALLLLKEAPLNNETDKLKHLCLRQIKIYSQAIDELSSGYLAEAKEKLSLIIKYKNSKSLSERISKLIEIYDLAKSAWDSKKYIYALNLFSCISQTENFLNIKFLKTKLDIKDNLSLTDFSQSIDRIKDPKLKYLVRNSQNWLGKETGDWEFGAYGKREIVRTLQYTDIGKIEVIDQDGSFSLRINRYEVPKIDIEYLGDQSNLIYDAELINYKDTLRLFDDCLIQIYEMYETKYNDMNFDEAWTLVPYLKAKKNFIEFQYTEEAVKKLFEEANELTLKLDFNKVLEILEPIRHYSKAKNIYFRSFFEIHGYNHLNYFFNNIFPIYNNKTEISFDYVSGYPIVIAKQSYQSLMPKRNTLLSKDWINLIFYPIENKKFNNFDYQSLANKIYEEIKKDNSHIFVKSEVFIILFKESDGSKINSEHYKIFLFDKNYHFSPVEKILPTYTENLYIVNDVKSELSIIQDKNLDAILCAKAFSGELETFEKTSSNLNTIINEINNQETRIIVEGPARSGKTILAFSLLKQFSNSILLLMNYHFYKSVKESFHILGIKFPTNRLFHHDLHKDRREGCILKVGDKYTNFNKEFITNLDFVIVDEAQRLADLESKKIDNLYLSSFDELTQISTKSNLVVFLGDDNQRINPKFDYGLDKIRVILKNSNIKFKNLFLDETIGIPPNIIDGIKYLLTPTIEKNNSINKFEISIYSDEKKFINDFLANKTYSKHYATLPGYTLNTVFSSLGLELFPYQLSHSDFSYFLNREVSGHFVYSTYELISRELQTVYLIIPSSITYNNENGIFDINSILNQPYLFNHLYVNMSRATQKLVIFTKNSPLYEYFSARIINLTKKSA